MLDSVLNKEDSPALSGKDRLIVALDVPTHKQAFELVERLDNVSFFKVGLQLLLAGDMLGFIRRLQESRASQGGVFVDLKLSGDIGNTITRLVEGCMALNVKFITLVEAQQSAITIRTLQTAREVRGTARYPRFLTVPLFSSLDNADLLQATGKHIDATAYIVERGGAMLQYGCDGLIVSGTAIQECRAAFGGTVDIVSPGIRPHWAQTHDHKRHTTPTQAMQFGADYLVVGRPIYTASSPHDAAQRIIDEIDQAQAQAARTSPIRPRSSHSAASSVASLP